MTKGGMGHRNLVMAIRIPTGQHNRYLTVITEEKPKISIVKVLTKECRLMMTDTYNPKSDFFHLKYIQNESNHGSIDLKLVTHGIIYRRDISYPCWHFNFFTL